MRRPGFEPGLWAWKAQVIPLDHRRPLFFERGFVIFKFSQSLSLSTPSHCLLFLRPCVLPALPLLLLLLLFLLAPSLRVQVNAESVKRSRNDEIHEFKHASRLIVKCGTRRHHDRSCTTHSQHVLQVNLAEWRLPRHEN